MNNSLYLLPVLLLLSSCGMAGKLTSSAQNPVSERGASVLNDDSERVTAYNLTSAQKKVVNDGVREMVAKVTVNGGEGAELLTLKAFRLSSGSGVHVCGDVRYQKEPGQSPLSTPYYLELESADGPPVAKRGQVGADKLKRSKVIFMCRHVNKR